MILRRIKNATRVLGAPPDWKDEGTKCVGLPVADVQTDQGNFMVSAWEPTQAEMQAILDGASVRLWVRGFSHPAVMIDVAPLDDSVG